MKKLIPPFIYHQYVDGRLQGSFEAYTMFVDLSGFTRLTEGLMRKGNLGAEQLSHILNEIFSPLVHLVYARGGFIPYFAGDAFTAIFPADLPGGSAQALLESALHVRQLFSRREYQFGEFTIGLKIGLSCGRVNWGIVGQKRKSYYFRGEPIDSCANCQNKASNQEIILDDNLRRRLTDQSIQLVRVGNCFRLASDLPIPEEHEILIDQHIELDQKIMADFFPQEVIDYNQQGEFRSVVALFISFEGLADHQQFDQFTSIVLDQMEEFSGYFKEIDFGDKGGVLVAFFGAPVAFENNGERALEFVHTLRTELRSLQQNFGLRFRAGVTTGTAYTGMIGGPERCQYAAVGNRVNLAARLMVYADWGEVLVDAEIQKQRQFSFLHKGNITYKGIEGPVPTYKLTGRDFGMKSLHLGEMVGRDSELKRLLQFTEPLFSGQAVGVAFIYGEAGIGKSRLTHELRVRLTHEDRAAWFVCQSDQILRKPFNPFIYFLKNYFQQTPDGQSAANLQRFENRFAELFDAVQALDLPEVPEVVRELARTRSVLAALIGIDMPGSLWDQLDAKGRYQNTLQAIGNLIHAISLLRPLVLELEDAHWIDENSAELLQDLVRHQNRLRLWMLITSRYGDDGAPPSIVERSMIEAHNLPWMEVNLISLQPKAVRTMAEAILKGPVSDQFYELLVKTTNSNPFYLEQLLEYFAELQVLRQEKGGWTIYDKDIRLSNSISAILTARIDRLSNLVRETVKAAAVIGREFEVPILSEVMKSYEEFNRQSNGDPQDLLQEQIHQAEQGQIWLAMNELRYIFRHSLLREAAYSMQLRVRLQQLHLSIAQSIERLYTDNLEERYVDLAFHYEQADAFEKTCEYLRKAADYARRNYQNHQALDFYERLLEKLSLEKDVGRQIRTHLKRGHILELIGQWDKCEEAYQHALNLAKKSRDVVLLGQANNSLGRLLMLRGDYLEARSFLQTAARLFESVEDTMGIARVSGNLGNLYFRQGKYEEAKAYFLESLSLSQNSPDPTVNAQIVANLGLTYMNQGDFDEGIRYQREQLVFCQQRNDKQGMATIYIYMGIVLLEKGDYGEALASFQQGLSFSEELGNKMLTAIALGSIGQIYERKGDYEAAMQNYQDDLRICEELGDKQGTAIALGLIGQLLNVQGEAHRAIEYLQKDLMLCEELGYQKGIAKAVNTLGDIFYNTHEYDRSLHFYNRAIEVTRSIGNKLVLGMSLVEKGAVLMEMGRMEELQRVCKEALDLAQELANPDLLFEAEVLVAKVRALEGQKEKAMDILRQLLEKTGSEDHKADVYYELSRLDAGQPFYKQEALERYRRLFSATPRHKFGKRIKELEA